MESPAPKSTVRVLICDDDALVHMTVKSVLKSATNRVYEVVSASHTDQAADILKSQPVDVAVLDVNMRTEFEGIEAIPKLKALAPGLTIIMNSGSADYPLVRKAMQLGATDYIRKDFEPQELLLAIDRVLERRESQRRTAQMESEIRAVSAKHPMLGESPAMLGLRKIIDKARATTMNVVITGETGSGKEVVARQFRSQLADGSSAPFVAVDSSTIQNTMAESLLFGHEKGAFTGAERTRVGLFEEADGGTVYFDEIANMPLDIQAKLLRVLQEGEVTRLGSVRAIPVKVRVICATNRNLAEMVKAGQFRDDLYQRLNVIPISVPPLRERKEDIPALVAHLIERHAPGKTGIHLTEDAMNTLRAYDWPGNVRELGNVIAYVVAMSESPEIDVADLPPQFREKLRGGDVAPVVPQGSGTFYERVEAFEKQILEQEYSLAEGNVSKMALKLGMDRSHLYTKLRLYGIHSKKT